MKPKTTGRSHRNSAGGTDTSTGKDDHDPPAQASMAQRIGGHVAEDDRKPRDLRVAAGGRRTIDQRRPLRRSTMRRKEDTEKREENQHARSNGRTQPNQQPQGEKHERSA